MFESARSKVRRAEKHISDLEEAFQRFVERDTYTVSVEPHSQGRTAVTIKLAEPVPDELGLTIGDAVHNLRSSLDHATWELIGFDNGTQDRQAKLPTGASRKSYEASCRGLKTPRDDTKQFFIDLSIYPSGPGQTLYELNNLNNIDKHRIMMPLVAAGRFVRADGSRFGLWGGEGYRLTTDNVLFVRSTSFKFDQNLKVIPEIFLRDWQGRKSIPAVPALSMLVEEVSVTLDAFDAFVADRRRYGR